MPKATNTKPTRRRPSMTTGARQSSGRPGRPRVAKADGNAPVEAFINALSGWKKEVVQRFDGLVGREVPNVRRAIKWSSPMYGIEDRGWFAAIGVFSNHVKLTFFRGTELKPVPPSGEAKLMRSLDVRGAEGFDEKRVGAWVRQASKLPGWGK